MAAMTKRQQIMEILTEGERTVRELAGIMELPISQTISELEHVARSCKRQFKLRPALCQSCGFKFTKRARFSSPSRCPKCRSERTEGPFMRLEAGD